MPVAKKPKKVVKSRVAGKSQVVEKPKEEIEIVPVPDPIDDNSVSLCPSCNNCITMQERKDLPYNVPGASAADRANEIIVVHYFCRVMNINVGDKQVLSCTAKSFPAT